MRKLRTAILLAAAAALPLGLQAMAPAHAAPSAPRAAPAVQPRGTGEIDCHGLSPIQQPAKSAIMCIDPRGNDEGRFFENGHYIGHDEPSVRFISDQPGSGSNVSFTERLPLEPAQLPTVKHPGRDVTHTFELSIAPWFSVTVCDPDSTPMRPCTPESDSNAPSASSPGAGAAFVELQFYPPGFAPFSDNISCDNTHWCSALTIDSLECQGSGNNIGTCNNNCTEPVNFAFISKDGVPAGPPSPQESDLSTVTPNNQTLLMNPGDDIKVSMFDARQPGGHRALETKIVDYTTGSSGFMVASAANGFMNTDPTTCAGTPFDYQPEYSSAAVNNIIPWGSGPYMLNTQFEIGHFEPCTSLTNPVTSAPDPFFTGCQGPYETAKEDPNLEATDAPCYPAGDTHGGTAAPNLVTGCDVFNDAVGDLDYDGTPYYPDWPDSVTPDRFPATFLQQQPVTTGGHRYPQIQFMTDASATELNTSCDMTTGQGCVLPPKGPGHFYPFWTLAKVGGQCVWEFGNMRNGNTFGGDAQYGSVGPATLGSFVSPAQANPRCG